MQGTINPFSLSIRISSSPNQASTLLSKSFLRRFLPGKTESHLQLSSTHPSSQLLTATHSFTSTLPTAHDTNSSKLKFPYPNFTANSCSSSQPSRKSTAPKFIVSFPTNSTSFLLINSPTRHYLLPETPNRTCYFLLLSFSKVEDPRVNNNFSSATSAQITTGPPFLPLRYPLRVQEPKSLSPQQLHLQLYLTWPNTSCNGSRSFLPAIAPLHQAPIPPQLHAASLLPLPFSSTSKPSLTNPLFPSQLDATAQQGSTSVLFSKPRTSSCFTTLPNSFQPELHCSRNSPAANIQPH